MVNRPPIEDPWVDALWIAQKYSVARSTAYRWIRKLTREHLTYTDGRFSREKKRHYVLRRVPLSLLEEHIDQLLN
jgi:transposase-like protein